VASRLSVFIRKLVLVLVALALLGLVLAAAQVIFHPFDPVLAWASTSVGDLDSKMSHEAFKGITIGSLALIVAICIFPIFLSRIDEKAYARGLWRGLVSAAVFYLSTELYNMAYESGRIHFIISIIGVILVSTIVIEGVSLAVKEDEERSFRTDIVSSIASGLLFSVLLKLGQLGLEWARMCLPR
jgi:hypothetical protein